MNQEEYFGFESVKILPSVLKKYRAESVFLVTGKDSYERCGARELVSHLLQPFSHLRCFDFPNTIDISDIQKGVALYKEHPFDAVVAIGGGSVIDMAKLINALSAQDKPPDDYYNASLQIIHKGKPLIAVPTTAGSGSEATHFATFYNDRRKYSLEHAHLLPDVSIIDPSLMLSMPEHVIACSGMDVIGHAMESSWSICSTSQSRKYAHQALDLVNSSLINAFRNLSEPSVSTLAKAANLAGKAINITKTTAAHAVSYPLTACYNIPHGHAVALTLPDFLYFNADVQQHNLSDRRGCQFVHRRIKDILDGFNVGSVDKAVCKLRNIMVEMNLKTSLSEAGLLNNSDIDEIVAAAFSSNRFNNNPRTVAREQLYKIINALR